MAIFDSHLFDNASGSVGNVTMCRFRNRNVVKAKISFKSKKQSTAQRVQQARFSILSALARYFCPAVQAGFPGKSSAKVFQFSIVELPTKRIKSFAGGLMESAFS